MKVLPPATARRIGRWLVEAEHSPSRRPRPTTQGARRPARVFLLRRELHVTAAGALPIHLKVVVLLHVLMKAQYTAPISGHKPHCPPGPRAREHWSRNRPGRPRGRQGRIFPPPGDHLTCSSKITPDRGGGHDRARSPGEPPARQTLVLPLQRSADATSAVALGARSLIVVRADG
jgi:hypothetical protein